VTDQQAQLLIGAETIIEMDKCAADALEEISQYMADHREISDVHRMAVIQIVVRTFEKRQTLRRDFI